MSNVTGERIVKEFELEIDQLKQAFVTEMRNLVASRLTGMSPSLNQLLDTQNCATRYFNKAEDFAGRVALLDVADKGKWVTGFAESCQAILNSLIEYTMTMNEHSVVIGPSYQRPSGGTYASLQRMVKEYLHNDAKSMQDRLSAVGLPTRGFETKPAKDKMGSDQKKAIAIIIGAVLLCVPALTVGVLITKPSPLLNNTCRALLGLGVALIASYLPGQLSTDIRAKYKALDTKIKATGALAVFVIVYVLSAGQ